MKHAGLVALSELEALLAKLRGLPGLVEKKPGIFYLKAKAYLHFHEDPAGLFADVRLDGLTFERFAVNTKQEQEALYELVAKHRAA